MSLAKVREYQEIDLEIYREENKILRSAEVQRMTGIQQQLSKAHQNFFKMDKESESVIAEIERLEARLADLVAKEKTQYSFGSVLSMSQADNIESALKEYSDEVNFIEREVKKLFRRLEELSNSSSKLFEVGQGLDKERRKLRSAYSKKSAELKEKYKQQIERLQELRTEIQPKLYAAYKNLRDNRKMPAFVSYSNGVCSGCGMEVKADVDKKLNNPGDLAECPHCRRILFI